VAEVNAASQRPLRSDGRRSRERLIKAAGALLTEGHPFTLTDVAARAGVSVATAYRHFKGPADVSDAFVAGFLDDVERRVAETPAAASADRLLQLNRIWVQTVLDWGPALTHLRSPEGFLHRRARGEPDVIRSLRHVEPAIAALLTADAAPDRLSYVISVWNALADPREILDQHLTLGWSAAQVVEHLQDAVLRLAVRPPAQKRPV
jgi:AcrR family transcriptional regulator